MKRIYWIIGIVIIIILISGWFIWNNHTICGPKEKGWNYDVSYCDKSCNIDNDCKYTCGCSAINKNEICHDEGIIYDCVNRETKCEKNKCVLEQMIEVEKIVYPEIFKGILLELNIANDKLTLFEYEIVDGYPNYLPGSYPFVARIYSFDEELLGEYGFGDPRIIVAEKDYTGSTWLDNVNFTQILPYFNNSKTVNIHSATKLLLSVDIGS